MQPRRKESYDIQPDIRPQLGVINGGGESTPGRGNLSAVSSSNDLDEQERNFGVIDGDGESTPDRADLSLVDPNGNIEDAKDKEESAGGWNNSYTGNNDEKQKATGNSIFQKKGPIALILTLFFGGAVTIGGFFGGPGLLIVNLSEVMTNKFNAQLASMDTRTDRILRAKIGGTTSGLCSTGVSIRCKYASLSQDQVAKFKEAGITVDEKGKTLIGGRTKPASFTFTDSTGKAIPISAKEFPQAYANNTQFRTAVKQAYNPKFAGFSDRIFGKVAGWLKLSKKAAFSETDTTDEKRAAAVQEQTKNGSQADLTEKLKSGDKKADGTPYTDEEIAAHNKAVDATGAIAETAERVTKDGLKAGTSALEVGTSAVKITGIADNACTTYGLINSVSVGAKTIRALQLARYAMIFLNTASMIKAGTARPGDVTYLGNIVTKITANNKKSATDSFGYRYAAYNDTGTLSKSATQYMAGGGLGGELSSVTNTVATVLGGNNPTTLRNACGVLKNPFVQVGSFAAGVALMIIPGGQVIQASKLVGQLALAAATLAAQTVLPALLADMIAGTLVDGTTAGEGAGDAITSGASGMMSAVAGGGGNAPLHPDQALAYTNLQQNVLAQYASEDRLAYSPLDPTSTSTFMGSLATKLMPYSMKLASVNGVMSSVTSLVGNSFGSLVSPYAKAASASDYTTCQDFDYRAMNLATDPFCNPYRGIPPQYLNDDPNTVNDRLGAEIDPTTGEPMSGSAYANFVSNCIDRTTPLGDGGDNFEASKDGTTCFIGDQSIDSKSVGAQMIADYYVHYIDQRVLDGMENGYGTSTPETSTTPTTGGASSGAVNPSGWAFPTTAGAPVSSPFGPREIGYHTGIDFGVGSGSPFYAARDGVVETREYNINTILGDGGAWCKVDRNLLTDINQKDIWIRSTVDGKPYTTIYSHMSKYVKKTGDVVKAGELIGYTGSSGCSTGPHVHFEIWQSTSPTPSFPGPGVLDPLPIISK